MLISSNCFCPHQRKSFISERSLIHAAIVAGVSPPESKEVFLGTASRDGKKYEAVNLFLSLF
jgi:hypothetical protein